MITRKIGNLIRGKATPFQLFAASMLASLMAFIPGVGHAPGLFALWFILLVVLNANLFLAAIVGAVCKILALLLMPVSFILGRALLDGPLHGLFAAIVNAPVLAFFGFDYYAVAGGQLVGLIIGILFGWGSVRLLRGIWRKMAALEKDSAGYQKWSQKGWVKATAFIFTGGVKGKKSYDELLSRHIGNPVRPSGIALVVVLIIVCFVGAHFLTDSIVTAVMRSGLERANGATVDLQKAHLDLTGGRLTVTGLAMADPQHLDTNLFAAQTIDAKISTSDLLRKRAVIDTVVVQGATQGSQRKVPGKLIGPQPKPAAKAKTTQQQMQSIDDILQNAKIWKERLATARRWMDRFSGVMKSKSAKPTPGQTAPTYEEMLRERVAALGYANVQDNSLIEKTPTLLIKHLEAADVNAAAFPGDPLTITGQNLSTQPNLVAASPELKVSSKSGDLNADLILASAAGRPNNHLDFTLKGLSIDKVASQFKSGKAPVQGGTLDVSAKGIISPINSDLPLELTLHNTKLSLGGSNPTAVSQLTVPVAVRGPLDNPSIHVDQSAFKKALMSAGKAELGKKLGETLESKLGIGGDKSKSGDTKSGNKLENAAKSLFGGFLKGKKDSGSDKNSDSSSSGGK